MTVNAREVSVMPFEKESEAVVPVTMRSLRLSE